MNIDLSGMLEKCLAGLGYELVDFEWSARGLLRVFIDKVDGITVDDCARVSNHLGRVMAVENIDYERLEVSSPGLDRPLKKQDDFRRFMGSAVQVWLHRLINGRRRFTGTIDYVSDAGVTFIIDLEEKKVIPVKTGKSIRKNGKKAASAEVLHAPKEITVMFSDIERARLVPDL